MKNKIKGYRAKILSSLLLIAAALSLFSCAVNKNLEINEESLKQSVSGMITYVSIAASSEEGEIIRKMEQEELDNLLKSGKAPFSAEALLNAIKGYEKVTDDSGVLFDIKNIDFSSGPKEIQAKAACQFEKRIVNINVVIDENGIIKSLSYSPEYTGSEIGQKALVNTVIGMCTVFLILALIAFIISLLKYIPQGKKEKPADIIEDNKESSLNDKNSGNLADDLQLVAVITAAITEYENLPDDSSFVVREIRRRAENRW